MHMCKYAIVYDYYQSSIMGVYVYDCQIAVAVRPLAPFESVYVFMCVYLCRLLTSFFFFFVTTKGCSSAGGDA